MGSADDYAPGASQGDGAAGDPAFSNSGEAAADPLPTSSADTGAANLTTSDETRPESDLASERDKYLRLAAEYDNFRKRSAKERQDAGSRAQAELVRHLIEAIDDVARFAHVDPATTDSTTIVQGVDMVEKKLLKALGNAGLEVINPVGETFDPALHEAVATEPTTAKEDQPGPTRVRQSSFGGSTDQSVAMRTPATRPSRLAPRKPGQSSGLRVKAAA